MHVRATAPAEEAVATTGGLGTTVLAIRLSFQLDSAARTINSVLSRRPYFILPNHLS